MVTVREVSRLPPPKALRKRGMALSAAYKVVSFTKPG